MDFILPEKLPCSILSKLCGTSEKDVEATPRIRNEIDHQASWSPEQHRQFLKKCEDYIGNLTKEGKLKSAQPLIREGKIISDSKGAWKDGPFNETKEVIVGYYHILAEDLNDAIAIAKGTPNLNMEPLQELKFDL